MNSVNFQFIKLECFEDSRAPLKIICLVAIPWEECFPWNYKWTKIEICSKKCVPNRISKSPIDSVEPGEGTSRGHIIVQKFQKLFYDPLRLWSSSSRA